MGDKEDREVELALLRQERRAELRSAGENELSGEIAREALSRAPKSTSTPPIARVFVVVLNTLPPWGRVIILMMLGALAASGTLSALASKFHWFGL